MSPVISILNSNVDLDCHIAETACSCRKPGKAGLIGMFGLALLISGYSHGLQASQPDCVDEAEYQKTREAYADTFAKYDLPTVSQEFLEAISAVEDLKDQLAACQKGLKDSGLQHCDSLTQKFMAKRDERDALKRRFSMALQMNDYLETLKDKLKKPLCAK